MTPPDPTDVVNTAVLIGLIVLTLRRTRHEPPYGIDRPRAAVDPVDPADVARAHKIGVSR